MSQLLKQMRESFVDEEYRYAYTESFMNSYLAAQIKTLREENHMSRAELAKKAGTNKSTISRLENVGYSFWTVGMLKRIARALGVRLKISFEGFGSLPREIDNFQREALLRLPFDRDPAFASEAPSSPRMDALALQKEIPQAEAYDRFALGQVYVDATRQ